MPHRGWRRAEPGCSLRICHDDLGQHERSWTAGAAYASRGAFARIVLGGRVSENKQPLLCSRRNRPRATALLRERGRDRTALLAVTADRALVLHSPKAEGVQFLAGLSARQRALDVVQLHKCLLEGVLKLSEESIRHQQNLCYLRDASEALDQVRNGPANVAFLMNPCPVAQVRDVAFAGEVMPQKSTDFYPKLLSGLTIYALD